MPQQPNNHITDIHSASSLTTEAIIGIVNIVESLHGTINNVSGTANSPEQPATAGIPGMVYQSIRAITGLVGNSIDRPLKQLGTLLGEKESSPGREAVLAALNGLIGDHLAARNNPLTIPMQLHQEGKPVSDQQLTAALQQTNGQLVVLVHGAFMNDSQWLRQGHDHGAALACDLGLTPLYLHYNSGQHISENGRNFSELLQIIADKSPQPLTLHIIAFSMGGLVSRSACYYARQLGHTWLDSLEKIIFLGTPHHGAPLEQGGNWINVLMDITPYSAPFSRLTKIRSRGITDLRYGNLVDEDWRERDRFDAAGDQRLAVPLPLNVACYTIAAATGQAANSLKDDLIGDGLVPVNSALGRHSQSEKTLAFPETHQWIGRPMNHLDLLNHPAVYETIKTWLTADREHKPHKTS